MHLVHPDALHFDQPVASYWEDTANPLQLGLGPLQADTQCDVAIIGGGFTGLSAAISLAEGGMDVCLLEAGTIGWGASGRNGGFACIGSHKLSYATMIGRYGLDATKAFFRAMQESVAHVADNALRHGIDIGMHGTGEVTLAHRPDRLARFHAEQAFFRATFGQEYDVLPREALKERGLHGPEFHGGLLGKTGFGIHPLNYVRGLACAAHRAGARLYPHSRLLRWEEANGMHHLHSAEGKVTARHVLVATNGYTPEDISEHHRGRILPALSNILVTRPLSSAERQAQGWTSATMAYDSRNLLHYFRLLPDNRFLFGGRGGTDSSNRAAPGYRKTLTSAFHRLFPAWARVDITHFWRGFVCLSNDLVPYVGPLDDRKSVWTSLAYHGNGVAMAGWCGRAAARMILGEKGHPEVPAVITRRLARFPLPAFRPLYLRGAYLWYGWKDSH
jgi:glycine/D-amino acid oxidase-like deaminating enzyme